MFYDLIIVIAARPFLQDGIVGIENGAGKSVASSASLSRANLAEQTTEFSAWISTHCSYLCNVSVMTRPYVVCPQLFTVSESFAHCFLTEIHPDFPRKDEQKICIQLLGSQPIGSELLAKSKGFGTEA